MELVYFLISFIEIVLTCFIVTKLIKANLLLEQYNKDFDDRFKTFEKNFEKVKNALVLGKKISLGIKEFQKYEKMFSKFKKLTHAINAINFLSGKKLKGKLKIFPIIRRLLFYV